MTDNYDLKYYKDIKSKKVDWLWYPYIPYGKITIVQGDPGEGKTTVLLNIISLLSNGEALPFTDKALSITSIYQNAEDDNSDTIKPRLENHKANCRNLQRTHFEQRFLGRSNQAKGCVETFQNWHQNGLPRQG